MKQRFLSHGLFLAALGAVSGLVACSAESSDPYPGGSGNRSGGSGATGGTAGTGTAAGGTGLVGAGGTGLATGAGGSTGGGVAAGGSTGGAVATGGTAGAGTGGTAGAACMPVVGAATDVNISDLEAGTNAINPPRTGYWYTYALPESAGSTIMPAQGSTFAPAGAVDGAMGADSSNFWAKVTGPAGINGVALAFDLNNCAMMPNSFDISAYSGITFWYRASAHIVRFKVATKATSPAPNGTCTPAADCYNHHGKDLNPVTPAPTPPDGVGVAVGTWTQVTLLWTDLSQTYGTMGPLDKANVLGFEWAIAGPYTDTQQPVPGGAPFIEVDQVAFTP